MSQIRPARVADARVIANLHIAGWRATYRGIMPDAVLDGLDLNEKTAQRASYLEAATSDLRENAVSCSQGEVRAWASWGPPRSQGAALVPGTIELYAIYAHPDHIGQGHGRALVVHALTHARDSGAPAMAVWYLIANERAGRFYARAGFAQDPSQDDVPFVMHDGVATGAFQRRLVAWF